MRNPLKRISPLVQIVVSVVLMAFAVLGITNAEHVAAKIIYGIIIVLDIPLFLNGLRRRRDTERPTA